MNKLPNPSNDNFDFSKPEIDHIILALKKIREEPKEEYDEI